MNRFKIWRYRLRARKTLRNADHAHAAAIMAALASSHDPLTRGVGAEAARRAEETADNDAARGRCRRYRDALAEGHRVKHVTYPALVVAGNELSLEQVVDIESALLGAFEEEGTEDE